MGKAGGVTRTASHRDPLCDLLHGRLATIDTMQQSLVAQVNIMAEAVKDTVKTNADMVWHLALHYRRLDSTTHTLERFTARSPSLEDDNPIQRMKLCGSRARTCTGHTLAASFVGQPVRRHCEDLDSSLADGNSKATHGVVDFMAAVDTEAPVVVDTPGC
jgi:hypothetical protein